MRTEGNSDLKNKSKYCAVVVVSYRFEGSSRLWEMSAWASCPPSSLAPALSSLQDNRASRS